MKLHLLDRTSSGHHSFNIVWNRFPNFLKIWHHHPELELVVVRKSKGTLFLGDSIEKFEEGEVVLIGKDLPHMWLNDDIYFDEGSNLIAEAIGVHFLKDFLGKDFLRIPEMQCLSTLFDHAERGVKFVGLDADIGKQLEHLVTLGGFERTLRFLEILHRLSTHQNYRLLSSKGFVNSYNKTENEILDKTYAYIFKHFTSPIRSKDVAAVAHMNASAFSRYFKRIHRKTFTRYLNEIRIGYACKLLMEKKGNVSSICYESGFNNISNFNRQFKSVTGMSPTKYTRLHS